MWETVEIVPSGQADPDPLDPQDFGFLDLSSLKSNTHTYYLLYLNDVFSYAFSRKNDDIFPIVTQKGNRCISEKPLFL